jgi:hypothetical protein
VHQIDLKVRANPMLLLILKSLRQDLKAPLQQLQWLMGKLPVTERKPFHTNIEIENWVATAESTTPQRVGLKTDPKRLKVEDLNSPTAENPIRPRALLPKEDRYLKMVENLQLKPLP